MWQIYNTTGKGMMAPFAKWIDAVYVIAKLHRLGMTVVLKKI